MGKLTDFVMAQKIRELSGEERIKIIRQENERKMKEVRERLKRKEQEQEWEKTKNEVFAEPPEELPTGTITCFLSSDILND